jgi:protein-disulfide isomerase
MAAHVGKGKVMQKTVILFIPLLFIQSAFTAEVVLAPPQISTAEVTIEVFSDFQCPYCKQFAPAVREIESKGIEGIKTTVEFKNFPLSFHPFAQLAAQAAIAAGEQGKFWEMHDLLFANQPALARNDLLKYARDLKLDTVRFEKDLDSERIKKLVAAEKADGEAKKVQGTPTFFVNGQEFSGTKSTGELTALVRADVGRRIAMSELTDALMSKGPAGAPVTIEFFADLESPVSRSADYVLEELMAQYPGAVRLQFRNYPLSFHPQAGLVHDAAMTAAREGHFWEMANYVFDHQESVREQDLIAYAGRLGMDQVKFAETVHSHRYTARVDADLADGFQRGVRGSPVIFVNGKRIDGVPSLQTLTEYVEAALSAEKARAVEEQRAQR